MVAVIAPPSPMPKPVMPDTFPDLVFRMRNARLLMLSQAENELPAGEAQSLYFLLGQEVDRMLSDYFSMVAQSHMTAHTDEPE
jgi:hypothetical protein